MFSYFYSTIYYANVNEFAAYLQRFNKNIIIMNGKSLTNIEVYVILDERQKDTCLFFMRKYEIIRSQAGISGSEETRSVFECYSV